MDNLFEILALNYFWGHLCLEMCMIVIQGIMKESCSLCDIILGHQGVGGGTASQDKNFSEIWVLKLRV